MIPSLASHAPRSVFCPPKTCLCVEGLEGVCLDLCTVCLTLKHEINTKETAFALKPAETCSAHVIENRCVFSSNMQLSKKKRIFGICPSSQNKNPPCQKITNIFFSQAPQCV